MGYHIYQNPENKVGKNVRARGVILDRVITDEGYGYDFFNRSHKVTESGMAWIYEMVPWTSEGVSQGEDQCISELQNLTGDTNKVLYSHVVLDLDSDDPYSPLTAAESLGIYIDGLNSTPFYKRSANQIIQYIDSGDRIMFAVLYNMYYYGFHYIEYNGGNGNWVTEVTWPYDSLSRDDAVRLWYRALTASVDNGGRQWGDSSIADGYITDWPAYTPGCCQYHPYFFMSHPGLVFECYRECPEEIYTIRSLNGFDNHREYHVDASRLAHILSGNHWGLQIFADGATPAYNHIANVFGTSALINNFSNGPAQIWRYEWPFDQYNEQGTVMNSDRQMMTRECTYNGTWTDPSTGIQYQTNMLYNGSPIDTPLNYPVFIAVTGHVNRVW